MQQRRRGMDLRKDVANHFRHRVDLGAREDREIQDLRNARDPDPVGRALAADEGQARGVAIRAKPSARCADRIRDQQQCVARCRHDELLRRDVRRNGAGDVCVGVGRRHDQHEVGAGDRGGGIVGDERKRREALAQDALVCDPADGAQRFGRAGAAAVEADVEAALRQVRRGRAAAVACADNGDGLDRTHRHQPMRYFAIFASSTSMPRPGPSGT